MSLSYVSFNSLNLLVSVHECRFKLDLVKPPFPRLQASSEQSFSEAVMVPPDLQAFDIWGFHRIAVLGISIATADAEYYSGLSEIPLEYSLGLVHVE